MGSTAGEKPVDQFDSAFGVVYSKILERSLHRDKGNLIVPPVMVDKLR